MKIRCFVAVGLCALLLPVMAADDVWVSKQGYFSLSYETALQPIEMNRIHSWKLHIEDADGAPVTGAVIEVEGGMPAHNHGLPTRPRVTSELGGGDYRLDGMRFHMAGEWEITISIDLDGKADEVVVVITL